jgi:hypothetical protein
MEVKDKVGAFKRIAETIEQNENFGVIAVVGGLLVAPMLIVGLGIGIYNMHKESGDRALEKEKIDLEKARIERGYNLYERDLNGNGVPDKFYMIGGKPAFVEVDGKPVVENPRLEDLIYR